MEFLRDIFFRSLAEKLFLLACPQAHCAHEEQVALLQGQVYTRDLLITALATLSLILLLALLWLRCAPTGSCQQNVVNSVHSQNCAGGAGVAVSVTETVLDASASEGSERRAITPASKRAAKEARA